MPEVTHVYHHYDDEYRQQELTGWEAISIILIVLFAPIIFLFALLLLPFMILLAIPVLIFYGLFLFFVWIYETATGKNDPKIDLQGNPDVDLDIL